MIDRLTASQKSRFRRAYRDAYAASDNYATLDALYTKHEALYDVSRDTLLAIVTEDHRRNRTQYIALHVARDLKKKQRRQAHQEQERRAREERKAEKKRKAQVEQERVQKQKLKRSGRKKGSSASSSERGSSVWTVSGGLPGLGKRR
jgi:hypothetical protein